ncbi:RPR domain containing [Cryptosporidium sp. chipmunk genotype I]|uniref:RPR domain containing n=1 Tax=Cryptosporidium sp. chipmunk genotype I TaxID=1280935 RepID=UPI00351A85CE|nr:RPR domain containing [Cryptosporidium sp. chipmunk genotype I]
MVMPERMLNIPGNDPLCWIWIDLDETNNYINSIEQSEDFTILYKKYLEDIKKNYDENLDVYDQFSSPIESLNCELSCERMPNSLEESYEKLLDGLTTKRMKINEVMTFVVDYSDLHSVQMIELLVQRFPNSSFEIKLSILYCISDILYNSHSSKIGAWKLRNCIMSMFPYLVSHISFQSSRGNSSYIDLINKTKSIIEIWIDWKIFPLEYIKGLSSSLYFDKTLDEMKNDKKTKLISNINDEVSDGILLDKDIASILSIWPIKSRLPVWKVWREMNNLLINKNLHEPKIRQDWVMNYGIVIAPIKLFGLTNFLHRVSNFYNYKN